MSKMKGVGLRPLLDNVQKKDAFFLMSSLAESINIHWFLWKARSLQIVKESNAGNLKCLRPLSFHFVMVCCFCRCKLVKREKERGDVMKGLDNRWYNGWAPPPPFPPACIIGKPCSWFFGKLFSWLCLFYHWVTSACFCSFLLLHKLEGIWKYKFCHHTTPLSPHLSSHLSSSSFTLPSDHTRRNTRWPGGRSQPISFKTALTVGDKAFMTVAFDNKYHNFIANF